MSKKQSSAMNMALNEVAGRGGNGLYVVSTDMSFIMGAAVTGEALRCRF